MSSLVTALAYLGLDRKFYIILLRIQKNVYHKEAFIKFVSKIPKIKYIEH